MLGERARQLPVAHGRPAAVLRQRLDRFGDRVAVERRELLQSELHRQSRLLSGLHGHALHRSRGKRLDLVDATGRARVPASRHQRARVRRLGGLGHVQHPELGAFAVSDLIMLALVVFLVLATTSAAARMWW